MKSFILEEGRVVQLEISDITEQEVDVIVNAANGYLRHGGGVAGALVRAGGKEIQLESDAYVRENGPLEIGEVAVTGAGSLHAKKIIHVFGPQYGELNLEEKLYSSFGHVLKKAAEMEAVTLATPAISTGIFGVPVSICANQFLRAVGDHLSENASTSLKLIKMCLLDKKAYDDFLSIALDYFSSVE
ncbi:macro domain-containing protein [Mesotoga sp.]|uniref:macro domain-containing protein n=2 Tax=Mesotoga sp. TaxID=2053577 RepID=UPI002612CA22|nr:macro domain-containing protein [Mesotoga sp.]MDD4826525.1 macro domain-containing protein [Mesotoga sp.]MDI9368019.1 macro domain-containing protein [Thermotogota bacterium]